MNYYRCENPDCGFLAEEEPDVCPQCCFANKLRKFFKQSAKKKRRLKGF